jgi:hypothetical protein
MAQLLVVLALVAGIVYFAFFSHRSANDDSLTPSGYMSEIEQAKEASQGQTYEMKKAKAAEQVMQKAAEAQRDNIDQQAGMAP